MLRRVPAWAVGSWIIGLCACSSAGEPSWSETSSRSAIGGPTQAASDVAGVVFVHGTGDYSAESALSDYWTQPSIDAMSGGLPTLVVGYRGASCAAFDACSWGDVASQIDAWLTAQGVGRIAIVTHSNGSNPVRFLVRHETASDAAQRVVAATRQVVFLAGDNTGTPLADAVVAGDTFASAVNGVLDDLGFGSYDTPAVAQQRTDAMAGYDADGTFDDDGEDSGASTLAGFLHVAASSGTSLDAVPFTQAGDCGGYSDSAGLAITLEYGWGASGCADGFIGCESSQYVGYAPGQGRGFEGPTLNHNQSRRSCAGVGSWVASAVTGALGPGADRREAPRVALRPDARASARVLLDGREGETGPIERTSRSARTRVDAWTAGGLGLESTEGTEIFVRGATSARLVGPDGRDASGRFEALGTGAGARLLRASIGPRDLSGTYRVIASSDALVEARSPRSPVVLSLRAPRAPVLIGRSAAGPRAIEVSLRDGERPVEGATADVAWVGPDGRSRGSILAAPVAPGAWEVDLSLLQARGLDEGEHRLEVTTHGRRANGQPVDRFGTISFSAVRPTARVVQASLGACDGAGCPVDVTLDVSEEGQVETTVRLRDRSGRLASRAQDAGVLTPGLQTLTLRVPGDPGARMGDVRLYSVARHALLDRWRAH